jgi:Calpain family cysteine protease
MASTFSPSISSNREVGLRPSFLVDAQTAPAAKKPSIATPRFDARDLYGKGGPKASDIKQDALGDCFFVATLGSVANAKPDTIRNAISYDSKTGNFTVKLYQNGKAQNVTISQADLTYNLARQGGSTVDNTGKDSPIWPAVMETAYAKVLDTNHKDGLKQGFDTLGSGGKARNALAVITGSRGTDFTYSKGFLEGQQTAIDRLGKQAEAALANGRPLTLSTDPERDTRSLLGKIKGDAIPQDGLVDNHVYVVEGIIKSGNDYLVTLRNPWGTNNGVGEGKDVASATITVSLRDLVNTGGFEYFNAGSAR